MTGPGGGGTPPQPPTEAEAKAWAQVLGLVSNQQLAAISAQLWYLTRWGQFLDGVDWSKIVMKPPPGGGPAGVPPPPPPSWPP
jgi:hypothetical protein